MEDTYSCQTCKKLYVPLLEIKIAKNRICIDGYYKIRGNEKLPCYELYNTYCINCYLEYKKNVLGYELKSILFINNN